MAILDPSGIVNGQPVLAPQVSNLYNALNGDASYEIIISDDLTIQNGGVLYGGSISGSSFTGSGLSLTGVITDNISASFLTTASFNTFSSSYVSTSASFASRIDGNDTDITNLFVASQSLNAQQNELQSWSSSIVINYLNDVQTVGGTYEALDGNILVYDTSVSKWRPSRSNVNVNITGSTTIEGATTIIGNTTATGNLSLIGTSTFTGPVGITGLTTVAGNARVNGNASITGSVNVNGSNVNLVAATDITGSLDVSGNTRLDGTVNVDGNTSITGSTFIVGDTNIDGDLITSGSALISGSDHIISGSSLGITAPITIDGTTDITGNTDVTGSFDVLGNTSLTGNVTVVGNTETTGDVTIAGDTDITGNVDVVGSITASQDISASGDMFAVTGSFQHLDVTGTSNLTGDLFIDGNITASGVISASGDLIGDDLSLGTGRITRTGGVGFIDFSTNPVTGITSLTASADISAGGSIITDNIRSTGTVVNVEDNLTVEGIGAITGSFFVSGSSNSVELRAEDQLLVDSDNITLTGSISFGILGSPDITGNLTASNNISASGDILGSTLKSAGNVVVGTGGFLVADIIRSVGDSVQISDHVLISGNLTASANLSCSATVSGVTGSFDYLDLSNTTITGSSVRSTFGPVTTIAVDHNLGEEFPIVQVYTASNRAQIVPSSIIANNANRVTVTFAYSTTGSIVILK